jgi:hypothetical protein
MVGISLSKAAGLESDALMNEGISHWRLPTDSVEKVGLPKTLEY